MWRMTVSQKKFYLGFDDVVAAQRRRWIENIWIENCLFLQKRYVPIRNTPLKMTSRGYVRNLGDGFW